MNGTSQEHLSSETQDDPCENAPQEREKIEPSSIGADEEDAVPSEDRLAIVHGRFLLPDGTPAEGADIELDGWPSNDEKVRKYGLPKSWKDPTTTTDEAGFFDIRFDPPQAYQFVMNAKLEGYGDVRWRWIGFRPGQDVDVGTVKFSKSGTILAVVKDSQGQSLKSGWTIYAKSKNALIGTQRDRTRTYAKPDPVTGVARLENLPSGAVELSAHSRMANWIYGPTMEVIAGQEVKVALRYNGPDYSRRINVYVWEKPFRLHQVDKDKVLLSKDGVNWQTSKYILGSPRGFYFDDLAPGLYTVKIEDPRFLSWQREGLEPGNWVSAHILYNGALDLKAFDAATGTRVDDFQLRINFISAQTDPNSSTHYNRGETLAPTQSEGLYTGIPPMVKCSLTVDAKGFLPKRFCSIPWLPTRRVQSKRISNVAQKSVERSCSPMGEHP